MGLQSSVGNRAVNRLLQRVPGAPTTAAPATPGGSALSGVLKGLLTPESMQRQGDAFLFRGARLTADSAQLGPELIGVYEHTLYGARGHEQSLDDWVNDAIARLSDPTKIVDARSASLKTSGPQTDSLAASVKTALDASRKWVHTSHMEFLADFQRRAVKQFDKVLDKSRDTVEEEKKRYGIKDESTRIWGITLREKVSMADNADSKLMLAALADLRNRYSTWAMATGLTSSGLSIFPDKEAAGKKYATEYNGARAAAEGKYPVIAAFNLDLSRGQELKGAFDQAVDSPAAFIGPQITKKLENISTARQAVWEKLARVWAFPSMVSLTKTELGMPPKSHLDLAVNDKVAEQQEAITNRNLILGALALGLAALAPATGGVTGVLATGLGAAMTAESIQEALLQDAMAGTDFDKAKAISKDEPNWYWLAAELVGTALDLKGMFVEFKALLAARREAAVLKAAAATGKDTSTFEKSVKDLRERGNARKPGLGDKLEQDVRTNSRAPESAPPDTTPASGGPSTARDPVIPGAKPGDHSTFKDEVHAHRIYNQAIADTPANEVGLAYCANTQEWSVVHGTPGEVKFPQKMFTDQANNTWTIMKHYHPSDALGMRIPSHTDFESLARLNKDHAWESVVEYINPVTQKKRYTYFGYDPADASKPYWVKYMDPAEKGPGAVMMERFGKGPHTPEGKLAYENFASRIEAKGAPSAGPATLRP